MINTIKSLIKKLPFYSSLRRKVVFSLAKLPAENKFASNYIHTNDISTLKYFKHLNRGYDNEALIKQHIASILPC